MRAGSLVPHHSVQVTFLIRLLITGLVMAVLAACAPETPPPAPTPTPRGAVVPTRQPRSATPSPTFTATPTYTPTVTETASATPTDTPSPTPTASPTETASPTASLTSTPIDTPSMTPSPLPTATDTPIANDPQPTVQTPTAASLSSLLTPVTSGVATPTSIPLMATGYNQYPVIGSIVVNTAVSGMLAYPQAYQLYTFAGQLDQQIDIEMTATSGSLQPSLFVIDPKGREIARFENREEILTSGAIRALTLPETGEYTIAAARLSGVFGLTEGTYTLSITNSVPNQEPIGVFSEPIAYDEIVIGQLTAETGQRIYTFRGAAGDRLNIALTRTTGDLDTVVFLTDNLGNVLAWNDDDLQASTRNSTIDEFILPASGYYSIVAARFLGVTLSTGEFRLKITPQGQAEPGILLAALDPVNSRTLRSDGRFFGNFSSGDSLTEETPPQELRLQSLITFQLPPPSAEGTSSATLRLEPCFNVNDGFDALGEITVYADSYGVLSAVRDFTRVSTGSRILSVQGSCTALDVTTLVQELYAENRPFAQFRISFRQSPLNGQRDEVLFSPRLEIVYTP